LIANENAHSIEDDVEDVCVHTDDEILCLKTVVKIRKRAYKEITPIPEIYDDEIASLNEFLSKETINAYIPPFRSMRSTLYNIRIKNLPKLPTDASEIILTEEYNQTVDKKRFLLFDTNDDDRVIAFCSEDGLDKLSKANQWHIDGTFKAAPSIYYQLIIVHAYDHGNMFPCCYILMRNIDYIIYKNLLEKLKEACTSRLNPKQITCDFELALIKALEIHFPTAKVKGCLFHYGQCIWKNVNINCFKT
jgi:hypothetical protein